MEWIRVEDALPEEDKFVLGFELCRGFDVMKINPATGQWVNQFWFECHPTHWVLLPEAPTK